MCAHEQYKPLLTGDPGLFFAESLVILEKDCRSDLRGRTPNRLYLRSFEEFPCFNEAKGFNSLAKGDFEKSPQMDALLNIAMGRGTIYYRDSILVGIEIKTSANDLRYDKKMFKYLGYSDFMYLAVTPDLIEKAIAKVAGVDEYGVFDITTGRIYKRAHRQYISIARRLDVKTVMIDYSYAMKGSSSSSLIGEQLFDAERYKDLLENETLYNKVVFARRTMVDDEVSWLPIEEQLDYLLRLSDNGAVSFDELVPVDDDIDDYQYEYK